MKKIIIPALSLVFAAILYSCDTRTYEDISPVVDTTPTYTKDIKPIMTANCTGCHTSGVDDPDLTNYENVKAEIDAIIADIENGSMPPSGALPSTTLNIIKNWKATGMKEN